ncbi:MAG: hypothetical protein K8S55_06960 [Phycisphaerae bacterium]|nr:hypothetical protein [Phycisphaerae bacterium]
MTETEKAYQEKRRRVLDAIEFKPTDRLPYQGNNGTIAGLQAVTGRDDYKENPKEVFAAAMKIWDVDLILQFVLPDRQDSTVGPGAEVVARGGLGSTVGAFMAEWTQKHGQFDSPEDLRDFCLSIPPVGDAGKYVDHQTTKQRWLELDAWGDFLKPIVWVPGHLCGTVSWMWYTRVGYENYLMAHSLYPEAMERLFAFSGEQGRLQNIAISEAIRENDMIPLVYSGEDICGNDGPFVSPRVLHEIYFPHLKHAAEPLIDAGVHWMWHSDGNIMPLVQDLTACGIDGYQGFEEDKGMDMSVLAQTPCKNGKLPFLCGSVNVTTTFYTTPQEVCDDVTRMIDLANSRNGGVIIAPSSSMMENMPVENILAYYDACMNQEKR